MRRRDVLSGHNRDGITMVELLVCIAVISILAAITVPAVQYAREAARRSSCQNNMHQMILAVHQHHDATHTLPISVSPFNEGVQPSNNRSGCGWIVRVLPFLEQQALYDRFASHFSGNFLTGGGLKSPDLQATMATQLPMLQCPSDESVRELSIQQWQWENTPVALTSYKGVLGDSQLGGTRSMHVGRMPDCLTVGNCTGVFHRLTYQHPLRLEDVKDGTSNTLAIGEDIPEHNCHSTAFYANGDYASTHAPLNYFPPTPRCRDWWDVMSFRSYHSGGANFATAGGHVEFVSQSIDLKVYQALSTRNGGETVSGFR
jgi:prepilin-type N-terminal cleavage/methylation domain-containing protein/prepilin-type processing-associated H-X9-DG protein